MGLLILYILFAVSVSFICSLLEACFLSITPVYIQSQYKKNKKFASILKTLKSNVNRPLSAILTINTIANTIGAVGVGSQVLLLFGSGYVALASGFLTFIILIFSEIIPKTLGASYWRKLAPFCAYTVNMLISVTYPFVWISEKIHTLLSNTSYPSVTREEFITSAEIGASTGVIGHKESDIIVNLLQIPSTKVSEIMTPRPVILAFDQEQTVEQVIKNNKTISFSRVPIYKDNLDAVEGIVHRYKIFEAMSTGASSTQLKEYRVPVHVIPESISVAAALDQFIKRKEHIFLVVDEYGVTTGILTLEDVIETILGVEIVDELDDVEDLRKLAEDKWKKRKQQLTLLESGKTSQK